ncbi:hypothetical protein ACFL08_03335 [Patescibacteria group bacterium]
MKKIDELKLQLLNEIEGFVEYVGGKLIFNYKHSSQRMKISEAYAFGKFIQDTVDYYDELTWSERQKFFSDFVNHENEFISVLAMLGCMPTSLFRKVLFAYNIDNSSPESFFRRLEDWQIAAINQNYNDVIAGVLPRAFERSHILSKKVKWDDVLKEPLNFSLRYEDKGAWNYNEALAKLGMGFPLYPEGDNDDRKAQRIDGWRTFRKFLSVKGDKEEFVIDDEGLYKFLYAKVRSNYLWGRNKVVELGKYVCPGFITTMLAMLTFFLISPICAVVLGGLVLVDAPNWSLPVFVLGIITPLWCALATLKYILFHIGSVIGFILKKILNVFPDIVQEALGYVVEGLGDALVSASNYVDDLMGSDETREFVNDCVDFVVNSAYTVWHLFLMVVSGCIIVYGVVLIPSFGALCAITISISLVVILVKELWYNLDSRKFIDLHAIWKLFLIFNASVVFLSSFCQIAPDSGMWLTTCEIFQSVLILMGLFKLFDYVLKEKVFSQETVQMSLWVMVGFLVIAATVKLFSIIGLWIFAEAFFLGCLAGLIYWFDYQYGKDLKKAVALSRIYGNCGVYSFQSNRYLMSLSVNDSEIFLREVRCFLYELSNGNMYFNSHKCFCSSISFIDPKVFSNLKKKERLFSFLSKDEDYGLVTRLTMLLIAGEKFNKALARVRAVRKRNDKIKKRLSWIMSVIKDLVTLYYLKKGFNKICPKIKEKKVIRF